MSNVIPFTFNSKKQIRAIMINGEPYFIAKDVALLLGYTNPQKAVRDNCRHCTPVGGGELGVHPSGLDKQTIIIPEGDVYRLIMRSTLPDAIEIQDWVVDEVLPQIRKTGSYNMQGGMGSFKIPQTMSEALRLAADQADQIDSLKVQAVEAAPKIGFHDRVTDAINCHDLDHAARVIGTGRNRLARFLRDISVFKSGTEPYQQYVDRGYFKITEGTWTDSHGQPRLWSKTHITGKGLVYVERKWHEYSLQEAA